MFRIAAIALVSLFSLNSFACLVMTADIEAITTGDFEFKDGACYVPISIESITPHSVCPLRLADKELVVRTRISKSECNSTDEETVIGTISSGGGGYVFTGEIF